MKYSYIVLTLLFVWKFSLGQNQQEKTYIGTEKLCRSVTKIDSCDNSDSHNPKRKWYHQNTLKIKGDSVFLDQRPISVYRNDTSYSASDGGFFYYRGIWTKISDSTFSIDLIEIFCDHCPELVEKQKDGRFKRVYRKKKYLCTLTKNGFKVNDSFYKQTSNTK